MVQVVLDHVVKWYANQDDVTLFGRSARPALGGVSLVINDGETVSVVGPSGCGKSTLLKVVAGLEYPDDGHVLYSDVDMTDIKPQDRGVGMVFQDYALYPSMKGKGNLSYYFEHHEHEAGEEERRVRETAELLGVGFDMLLGRLPDTLSGGEKQRVAIGRCIVREPTVFLMDEPIVNLDAKLRERTRIEIRKLLHRFAITTLYVTHDQQEAIFVGDRIAVMRAGLIEQIGTFDDLYYSPANQFVATFVGTPPMAIIPAEVVDGYIAMQATRWPLPPDLVQALPPGRLCVGVRPEGWQIDVPDGVCLRVRHIERIPSTRAAFIHGSVDGAQATAMAPVDYPDTSEVKVMPDWMQACFFAAEGEAALHVPGAPELF